MTKSKRNLLFSVLVLVLTVAIAGGSTYAWFTTNQKVTVADMDVNVTTGSQGLYISPTSDGPFKTYLSAEDLVTAGFYKDNIKMDAVTTTDGTSFKNKENADVAFVAGSTAQNSYIQFKVFFRATSADETVAPTVKLSTFELTNTADAPRKFYNGLKEEIVPSTFGKVGASNIAIGSEVVADAAHAARVGFQANTSFTDNTGSVRVCDPHKGDEATYRGVEPFDNSDVNSNLALFYYNKLAAEQGYSPIATVPTLKETQTITEFSADVLKFSFNNTTKSWEGSLVIRAWLEGFDGDCLNAILGESLKLKLAFAIA